MLRQINARVAQSNGKIAVTLLLAAAVSLLISPQPAGGEQSVTDYAPALQHLRAAIQYEVQQKRLPGLSISLVDQDRVVWAEGFGFQDAEQQMPATAETVYRVGSVSKLFTDIVVMQLVEDGRLDLDVPIQTYLPDLRPQQPSPVPITLRQLSEVQLLDGESISG